MVVKKKILFVHHAVGIGGAPISMIETIKKLNADKYDVEVLLIKNSVVKELLEKEGIKCSVIESAFYAKYYQFYPHIVPAYFKWYQVLKIIAYAFRWLLSRYYYSFKVLKKYDYDIVHFNSSVLSDWLCAGGTYGHAVIHIREPVAQGYFGFRKWIMKRQIRKYAAHIIAISKDNSLRLGLEEMTTVVYNFTPLPDRISDDSNAFNSKNVLYLGGDDLAKGYLTVVSALDFINPGITVLFCGNYRDEVRSDDLGLLRVINIFKSLLPRNRAISAALSSMRKHPQAKLIGMSLNVHELLQSSAFLISPFAKEHFARPVIEAFANSRAAVATRIEGMDEIIDDGVNGILIPKEDPVALGKAINYLIESPEVTHLMGMKGREKAEAMFSPENIKKIEIIYDALGGK